MGARITFRGPEPYDRGARNGCAGETVHRPTAGVHPLESRL